MKKLTNLEWLCDDLTNKIKERKYDELSGVMKRFNDLYAEIFDVVVEQESAFGSEYRSVLSRLEIADTKINSTWNTWNLFQLTPKTTTVSSVSSTPTASTSSMPSGSTVTASGNTYSLPNFYKLKGLDIPTFNGNLRCWKTWWESYNSAVHTREMPVITKFQYLKNCLRGKALEKVEGFDLTPENYESVISALKDSFGDTSILITVYHTELEELPEVLDNDADDERKTLDNIVKILNNLNSLGAPTEQAIIRETILGKFSDNILDKVLQKFNNEEYKQTVQEIVGAISSIIKTNERKKAIRAKSKSKNCRNTGSNNNNSSNNRRVNNNSPRGEPLAAAFAAGQLLDDRKSKKKSRKSNGNKSGGTFECAMCKNKHNTIDCEKYVSLLGRREQLAKENRCFYCMKTDHRSYDCTLRNRPCTNCGKSGHAMVLCVSHLIAVAKKKAARRAAAKATLPTGTFIETFTAKLKTCSDVVSIRAMLDSGSKYSYIDKKLSNSLGLTVTKHQRLNLCTFGQSDPLSIRSGEVQVTITNETEKVSKNLNCMVTSCLTSRNMETAPSDDIVRAVLPDTLKYADPNLFVPHKDRQPLDLIIGNNHQFDICTGVIRKIPYSLALRQSHFGWIPTGEIRNNFSTTTSHLVPALICAEMSNTIQSGSNTVSSSTLDNDIDLDELLGSLFDLEVLGIRESVKDNVDDLVLEQFRQTVLFENHRYVVRWPWKQDNPDLPSNARVALARLEHLIRSSDNELLAKYDELLKEQLASGIIEFAPPNDPCLPKTVKHYLPHRALLRNNKLRVVYDASAKTKTGKSLNDLLHRGPVLLEDLVGLLLNFRLFEVGLTADIEKAFLQVALNILDRDCVRFFWLKDLKGPICKDNLIIYRFARVPFGVISSPFLLNIVLQELLSTPEVNVWHLLCRKKFYVDNLVLSVPDTGSALNVYKSMTSKLSSASFNLRDWTSNDASFLSATKLPQIDSSSEKISILGLLWDRYHDTLNVKLQTVEDELRVTKRIALRFYASIYDPLGLFSPCTLRLKLFIRDCWKNKYTWNEVLPTDFVARWLQIYRECLELTNLRVSRLYWSLKATNNVSLHVFCDASSKAFACCAYLVCTDTSACKSESSLIYTKCRAAPIDRKKKNAESSEMSIPNLELMAALIGKRTAVFLKNRLDLDLGQVYLWTDATTVLQWLHSTSVLTIFVRNRINEIRQTPNLIFRYVPSEANPADIASRGSKPSILENSQIWWKGPSWLVQDSDLWPKTPETTSVYETPVLALAAGEYIYKGILDDKVGEKVDNQVQSTLEESLESWDAAVLHFKSINAEKCRTENTPLMSDVAEYQKAQNGLISELQEKYFPQELAMLRKKLQPNVQLDLFLDNNGLIRCKGRLENVDFPWDTLNPILLPRKSRLVRLYVEFLHISNHHIGCSHLLAKLREKFWVIKGRVLVKSVLHQCKECKRWEGGSYSLPPLPPLPLVRVAEVSPFLHVGIDYLGPLSILDDNHDTVKVYVALFVCLVTRAIHLEVAKDLSAVQFLMCFKRFTNRRGAPKFVISDNAKNFKFVQPLVGKEVQLNDYDINHHFSTSNICWYFIPAYAPWHGGAYERLVALVKSALKKSYGLLELTYDEFHTALCDIEFVINSRPLTYLSSDEILEPLTPNHFLLLRTSNVVHSIDISEEPLRSTSENLISAYRNSISYINNFWEVFRKFYLLSLRERHIATHPLRRGSIKFRPAIGDIVLIKEPSAPRAKWKEGIVVKVNRSGRLAFLNCNGINIVRTINHLYPLELSEKISESTKRKSDSDSESSSPKIMNLG